MEIKFNGNNSSAIETLVKDENYSVSKGENCLVLENPKSNSFTRITVPLNWWVVKDKEGIIRVYSDELFEYGFNKKVG